MTLGRDDPQLKLRLSEELKQRVTEAARRNNRSVNAEIVMRLEASLIDDEVPPVSGPLGRRYDIPEDTPDAAIDEAIQKAMARALRSLEVRRVPTKRDDEGSDND